jgi:hypothetical protein
MKSPGVHGNALVVGTNVAARVNIVLAIPLSVFVLRAAKKNLITDL